MDNNHFKLQALQNEVSQLENKFLKWKIALSQLPNHTLLTNQQFVPQILSTLNNINHINQGFCQNIQRDIHMLNQKITNLTLFIQNSPHKSSNQITHNDQKYRSVTSKIQLLQTSLKSTQQKQKKLIEAINMLMEKYKISEQPTIIQNDNYFKGKIHSSYVFPVFIQQNQSGTHSKSTNPSYFKKPHSDISIIQSSKKQSRIYELTEPQKNLYTSVKTNDEFVNRQNPGQFIRTFSKVPGTMIDNKISLKQQGHNNIHVNERQPSINCFRSITRSDSTHSIDKNQHRFKFMMNNL